MVMFVCGRKQALREAYSVHYLRSWGVLIMVNLYCKNGSLYPVLTWSEFIPDMHQACMVNDHYTKYE